MKCGGWATRQGVGGWRVGRCLKSYRRWSLDRAHQNRTAALTCSGCVATPGRPSALRRAKGSRTIDTPSGYWHLSGYVQLIATDHLEHSRLPTILVYSYCVPLHLAQAAQQVNRGHDALRNARNAPNNLPRARFAHHPAPTYRHLSAVTACSCPPLSSGVS